MLACCRGQTEATPVASTAQPASDPLRVPSTPVEHVVIIVQENRSVDNLFNGFPGANTVRSGENSKGQEVPLSQVALAAPYDLSHKHSAFVTEYANGELNGFNLEGRKCNKDAPASGCPPSDVAAYGYVPESDVEPYWAMAAQYTLGDEMFQTNQGPSFPAHQYLVSGTSTISDDSTLKAAENPVTPTGQATGGCDSRSGSTVLLINLQGKEEQKVYPCFNRISLMQVANDASVTWRYYEAGPGAGIWHAPDAIREIRYGSSYKDVVWPSVDILRDIRNGDLANISWVTPTVAESDHPGKNNGTGPSWVGTVVNAIGESPYWSSTVVFVVWDDWGGWYEHVPPKIYNSYELGFRVPLLVISPYSKRGYVSHVPYEFGSILKFIESTFDLPSMGTTDVRATDVTDCFDFNQFHPFKHIQTEYSAPYFEHQAPSNEPPDDDW